MARNPSAALRVLLAGLLAAGPLPAFAKEAQPAPQWAGKTESWGAWSMFEVPGLGSVYCHYTDCAGSWEVRRRQQAGGLSNAWTWARRAVGAEPEPILGAAVAKPGTKVPLYKQVSQKQTGERVDAVFVSANAQISFDGAGFVAYLPDGKTAPARGQSMLSNANGTLVVTLGAVAAPQPTVPPRDGGPTPPRPGPSIPTPTPVADFKGPFQWRSVPINDNPAGTEHRKCKKEECSCSGDSCKGRRIALYVVAAEERTDTALALKLQADADYYLTYKGDGYNVCWVSGQTASVPVPYLRGIKEDKFLPDASYWVKGAKAGGDFKGVSKLSVAWNPGEAAVPAHPSEDCSYQPAATPTDPLAAKLDELFPDKVERALADALAGAWAGKTGDESLKAFKADLDKALGGTGKDAFLADLRNKFQAAAVVHLTDDKYPDRARVSTLLVKRAVNSQELSAYACKGWAPTGDPATAAGPQGAQTALDKAKVMNTNGEAALAANTGEGASMLAGTDRQTVTVDPNAAGKPKDPRDALCRAYFESIKPPVQPPARDTQASVPPLPAGTARPPDKEDAGAAAAKAKADKNKLDLKRAVIGGMGGALVLGVFGFIFGGPIGALAMGAVGFGVMAGVSYLNNNPIE